MPEKFPAPETGGATEGDQPGDHGFSPPDVVFCGGCCPLRVKTMGVVGAVTLSGLTDLEDHQFSADTLAKYLDVKAPTVPGNKGTDLRPIARYSGTAAVCCSLTGTGTPVDGKF